MKVILKYKIYSNGTITCYVFDEEENYICLATDKTERKAKEKAIKELGDKLRKCYKEEKLEVEINQPIQGESNG